MSNLRLFFLGSPGIDRDGTRVEVDTRKAIALLAYLTLGGTYVSRDVLSAFLWPELDDSRARAALRRTLSSLKSAVGEDALYITRNELGVIGEALWCDVLAFRDALAVTAHNHTGPELCVDCLRQLEDAVALYRDDLLTGFSLRDSLPFDDWLLQESERLHRELSGAVAQLVYAYAARGDLEHALDHGQRWLLLDPLREEAHRQLMQLYAWSGQRSAALLQYRECVRVLQDELGVAPLAETTALYQTILNEELDTAPAAAKEAPNATEPDAAPARLAPLVGREAALDAMSQLYSSVGPDGRFLAIVGEAGIGKTHLTETFLAQLPRAHQMRARCYEGETGLAYAPFVQALRQALHNPAAVERLRPTPAPWLAEAARLLPELETHFANLPAPPPLDWPGTRGRFLEGIGRVLEALLIGEQPGILWLDDAQWADTASLDLLTFLARRWQGRANLLVVCWRESNLPADGRLQQLLAEARRDNVGQLLTLSRLAADDVTKLVKAVTGSEATDTSFAQRLFAETEGVPFLITAYLHAWPHDNLDNRSWSLPPTARDLFLARLAQASETGRQLLQAAAVIGRAFTFDLLLAASGRAEEETVIALEQLLHQRLLLEQPGDAPYDFKHHKLRELAYDEMSLVRRRLLHRRIAQALRGQLRDQSGATAGQIAFHLQHAGNEEEAALFYREAGDYELSLFAHSEALAHYQSALALGHPQPALLHERCGDIHVRLGDYSAALASYERAAAAADPAMVPHLEHKIGQVYYRRGQWSLAEHYFAQAEHAWSAAEADPELARLYVDWSTTAYRSGAVSAARSLAAKAERLATTPPRRAQVANILGILARAEGHPDDAIALLQESAALATEQELIAEQIAALNNLARTELDLGRLDESQGHLETALHLCLTYGDRHWEAALRNNLADLLHQRGQEEVAMRQLKVAVTLYAGIDQERPGWQPEIWKLTEW